MTTAQGLAHRSVYPAYRWQEVLDALGPRTYLLPLVENLVAFGTEPMAAVSMAMMATQEEYAISKIAYRMDPNRAPEWSFRRAQPRPFIYDPARQLVHIGDDRVWTCFPIHDPVWRLT